MIHRIDVRTTPTARNGEAAVDPMGEAIRHQIQEFGRSVGQVRTSRIFLIDTDASPEQIQRVARELLADPIVEQAELVSGSVDENGVSRIEVHLKPGVTDPVAASTEMAIRDMGLPVREVRTGRAYLIEGNLARQELNEIATKILANGVIESIHFEPFIPHQFPRGQEYRFRLIHVPLRDLSDEQLIKLSREGHLFLSLAEMKTIQNHYRELGREPTDIELETLAQTWSEHCVHKTLKSAVEVEERDASGKVVSTRRYDNLIRDTIFQSTMDLIRGTGDSPVQRAEHGQVAHATDGEFCLSVFKDNAGVVAFDETDAVCFKVETHNHPSAIEPYGGSATGVGGVIRDIMGTGLGAKPVANTDVFCVAYPQGSGFRVQGSGKDDEHRTSNIEHPMPKNSHFDVGCSMLGVRCSFSDLNPLPKNVIHPRRILQKVVAGVRDYGNRMGIPTVNGAVYFDNRYVGNPLVFCGCVGIIPRDKIAKEARFGDAIIVMGGRTGRDGIHGATFSSAELTDSHAEEFSHAVQIGNAITEKKMADVILQARYRKLFSAITDCGAGGLSSAVGEMGEKIGAEVDLDKVPLKYAGLSYSEIWISEAQERMVLSVPQEHVAELLKLSKDEDVEATVIGTFGTERCELILRYSEHEVGRISMQFLHEGIPMPTRKAVVFKSPHLAAPLAGRVRGASVRAPQAGRLNEGALDPHAAKQRLLELLAHPNIASKHWIIRQYDHEVQGGSVIKPLLGPHQIGPSDAAVIRPKLNSYKGVAIGCGFVPHIEDPYEMALASIDEAIRNVVAVGAHPDRIALLDNFCWPSVDDEKTMGELVRACEACRDAALAYRIPFISGKDSLHNQFTNQETGQVIRIPNTLLISAIGVVEDVRKCVSMDLKDRTHRVALVSARDHRDLQQLAAMHRAMADVINRGSIAAAHDVSDGGIAVAAAEMCIASGLGLIVGVDLFMSDEAFSERPGRYLIELNNDADLEALRQRFAMCANVQELGLVQHLRKLTVTTQKERVLEIGLDELTEAWRGTLDW